MTNLKAVIEQIRDLPSSEVDNNFRQGYLAMLKQFDCQIDEAFIDTAIQKVQEIIATLKQKAMPSQIPEDYVFFLEFYGGLYIDGDDTYYFSTHGLGPMSEEWYDSIISPDSMPESIQHGFLAVGTLTFHEGKHIGKRVEFFLDVADTIQRYSVIGIGPLGQEEPLPPTIIKNVSEYPKTWHKVADSFTHWLQRAAETRGAFDYV